LLLLLLLLFQNDDRSFVVAHTRPLGASNSNITGTLVVVAVVVLTSSVAGFLLLEVLLVLDVLLPHPTVG
jgi:hypothetical protein